jgi:hypothetical protein
MRFAFVVALVGCASSGARTQSLAQLRAACPAGAFWTGKACTPLAEVRAKLAAGKQALVEFKVDDAKLALDAAEKAGPLDHDANVTLWEQRGIAAAYVDDVHGATYAFDMVLALDPRHFLSYKLSPKATLVFEKVRDAASARAAPEIDVDWPHGGRVGEPVPLHVEVLADPKRFLERATLYVRARGDDAWRSTDVALAGKREQRVVLPPVRASRSVSLELYARGYDDKGNEVLAWADPTRPREIPLRYDPPPPWYRKWWVITLAASALAIGTGVTVYELTLAPPDKIGGSATVH